MFFLHKAKNAHGTQPHMLTDNGHHEPPSPTNNKSSNTNVTPYKPQSQPLMGREKTMCKPYSYLAHPISNSTHQMQQDNMYAMHNTIMFLVFIHNRGQYIENISSIHSKPLCNAYLHTKFSTSFQFTHPILIIRNYLRIP